MEYLRHLFLAAVFLSLIIDSQCAPRRSRAAKLPEETSRDNKLQDEFKEATTTTQSVPTNRRNKALNLFGYYPSFLTSSFDYSDDDDDVNFTVNDENFEDEEISRTIPTRRRQQNKKKNGNGDSYPNDSINSLQYDNSPIFYIRLSLINDASTRGNFI